MRKENVCVNIIHIVSIKIVFLDPFTPRGTFKKETLKTTIVVLSSSVTSQLSALTFRFCAHSKAKSRAPLPTTPGPLSAAPRPE